MAWNTPGGSSNKDGRNPWQQRRGGGGGFDRFLDPLRNLFGGNGGGIGRWVAVLLVLWLAFNTFVLVTEQQRGVVLRFGQFARVLDPGPHFKWPWPIERVTKVEATQIQTFNQTVPVLTRDENIVRVEINVQYRVGDPVEYLFATRDARRVLEQAALSTVREQVGRSTLDTVLGARSALSIEAKKKLQTSLDVYKTGLVVSELNLPNARPPDEVKPAFDDVNSAQQEKEKTISESQAYAARIVPEARGQAAQIRTGAQGYRTASIARATGDAARFDLLVTQYKDAPEVTRKRLWLETLQDVLSKNRKIVGDGRQLLYVPLGQPSANAQAPVVVPMETAPVVEATPEKRESRSRREEDSR
ncbi:MAG: FtsH protease activity modulator HflK [Lysobacter sp.]|nr:FtsH protease activity modulator HflK [Lysobacter sp.]